MSNFIEVKDRHYNESMLLNIDSISYISLNSGYVLLNGTHGENTGLVGFDKDNIQRIVDAIKIASRENEPCVAHGIVGCREH